MINTHTQPFFVVSSGRSGTQLMEKIFSQYPQVEMHHEYLCTHVQPLAVKYYMGLISAEDVCATLAGLHGNAIAYCSRPFWGDSSNKLSWLIGPLSRLFPEAKFIYVVRDGRKVTSSFFHKLRHECYDDESTAVLQNYIDHPEQFPPPPPEKKYWWNLPSPGSQLANAFREFNQFQRICFHWGEVNRWIQRELQHVNPQQQRAYRLEDLVGDVAIAEDLLAFIGLPFTPEISPFFKRPHNVGIPVDTPLSAEQLNVLMKLAGDIMHQFGYDESEEYAMKYDSPLHAHVHCGGLS